MSNKSKITEMTILDLKEFMWNCQPTVSYLVKYSDKLYRKYSSHWEHVNEDDLTDMYMVDIDFQSHLNRAWEHHFNNKIITKKTEIIIA